MNPIITQDANGESALRMRVAGSGCSGFQYPLAHEEALNAEDLVFTSNGVTMFIDQKSAVYLTGVQIDYVNGLNASGFKTARLCALDKVRVTSRLAYCGTNDTTDWPPRSMKASSTRK